MSRINESIPKKANGVHAGRKAPKQVLPLLGGDICKHKYIEHNLPFIEIYTHKSDPVVELEEQPNEEHTLSGGRHGTRLPRLQS